MKMVLRVMGSCFFAFLIICEMVLQYYEKKWN